MLQDQLIGVIVATVLEPAIRYLKTRYALTGSAMLAVTTVLAGAGAVIVVGIQVAREGGSFDLDRLIAVLPTIFAVGQVIYALL